MAITLVVNPGSTSRKYAFYRDTTCLAQVSVELTDSLSQFCVTEVKGVATCETWAADSLDTALAHTLTWAMRQGLLADRADIVTVAVRVVAPGARFQKHQPLDATYLEALRDAAYLVPVHIPIVLRELAAISDLLPGARCLAVSDSAFHATMWPQVRTQSLPGATFTNYGYHGLSCASIARRLAATFGTVPKRTVVLHIGGGVSIAALHDGEAVATSMGFTPASGVMMGTRGGDIGADAMLAYMRQHALAPVEALAHLYEASGFKALTGVSDLRLVMERAACGDEAAHLALTSFVQQVATEVAARCLLLGGVDAVVLTGTASVRNPALRAKLLAPLHLLGIVVSAEKNDGLVGKEGRLETADSVPIMVMVTDEMGEMARIAATASFT